ncbi:hypothetical protein PILCRDRAFT_91765 [Piloderma croceum F 1598]|uniref:Uncharacterized protein n=1 Tax=Piloderma croceum (strain F 1598) TaxID=765440 RepID=A0A0C3BFP9_PILCF|nr:hypothetical protein PILCRDRAFT_91765 [Piloderma croceum F 1598]
MAKCSPSVLVYINNSGHNTCPAKKLCASNKENDGSLSSPTHNKTDMSCLSLVQPPLVSKNGQIIVTPVPWPSIEEVKDDDREPAIDPLPFDANGPIIIEALLSITGSGLGIDSTEGVAAKGAHVDVNQMLKPPQPKGGGYKECKLPLQLQMRLEWVASLLHVYTQCGTKQGINVQKWAQVFIKDRDTLSLSLNGAAHYCRIDDEDTATEIATHLQSLGPYI